MKIIILAIQMKRGIKTTAGTSMIKIVDALIGYVRIAPTSLP